MKCPSCGARAEYGKFCSGCGGSIQGSPKAQDEPQAETKTTEAEGKKEIGSKKGSGRGCLTAVLLLIVVPGFMFNRCLDSAGERAEQRAAEYYSPKNMILDLIGPGEPFEINNNIFAEDSSNYEDALDRCIGKNSRDECEAALEEVVGEPVDLEALYAAENDASNEPGSSGGTAGGAARFRASVGDVGAVDSDTVVAEVTVRNKGNTAGAASCLATIDNTTGNSGHDIFTTRRIKPGSVYRARVQLATENGTARITTGIDLICS